MKRTALALTFILKMLVLLVAGAQFLKLGRADPYLYLGDVPPDPYTKPPNVLVFSPQNNTAYASNNVSFSFNVSKPESPSASSTILTYIYYKADWQQNTTFLYNYAVQTSYYIEEFNYSHNFTGIPEGKHSIVIYADGKGWYPPSGLSYYGFEINGSSTVFFTVDTTPPRVSVLSLQNKTYSTNDIPLNVTVNESVSKVTYSLDGHENVTITGNTTLNGLSNGAHNLTVYAQDNAGNIGASETIYFSIEPFPTTLVIASVATVAVISAGLIVYLKKRNHKAEITTRVE